MNKQIQRLAQIAAKPSRLIIGLMSGTSFDGLDIALCKCSGAGLNTTIELLQFATMPYNDDFKKEIKSIFSKRDADLEKVCLLNAWIGKQHAALILQCLNQWNVNTESVDLIASHGQTIYHAPKHLHQQEKFSNATLQIGDGDHIAVATGIITISDFRQKHIAAGGEGAPLAVYGDYLLFSQRGENRIMLNIGGISNFTFLPGSLDASIVFSSDIGTGNTLMDAYVQQQFSGKYFDENANIAITGKVHQPLLNALLSHTFFQLGFPKTIGPELFNLNYLHQAMQKSNSASIPTEDVLATLNEFSAQAIVNAIKATLKEVSDVVVYISGGGMHNPLLMQNIQRHLIGVTFKDTSDLAINPDAKEAVLFALLANECVSGGAVQIGNSKSGIPSVSMGKISFPG
jgi:anhydro-N-acetylmuramic acid kinase